jgi:competence protein ComEC
VVNRARERLDEEIAMLFGPKEAALVSAVATGGRLEGMEEIRQGFRDSGLVHLLSISGTHFGFFGVLLFGLMRFGLSRLPRNWLERMTERLSPSEAAALLTLPLMFLYLLMSGARVPSVRAFIITGMFLLGLLLGRRGGWLHFLGLAAVIILVMDPGALAGASFQMSFLAVFFIGMFLRRGDYHIEEREKGVLKALRVLVIVSIAATAGVLPLVALRFHYASLVSPLANLVVTPLVSMVLVPLALIGAISFLVSGYFITWPLLGLVAKAAIWLAGLFASLPYASVPVPAFPPAVIFLYYAGFLIWFASRQRKALLLVPLAPVAAWALVAWAGAHWSAGQARVTFLDAGRADAAVIELPHDGGAVVVDTGRSGREVEAYLRHRGLDRIQALVLTHGHLDHAGGAARIAGSFDVREVWDQGWIEYEDGGLLASLPKRTLRRGDAIEGEGFSLHVLHPYEGYESERDLDGEGAVNDRSLVFRFEAGGASFLFTSDIGEGAVMDMLHLPRRWLRSDVLKAPHHGLGPRVQEALADVSGPGAFVVTSPRLGKGAGEALDSRPGVAAYVTGLDGAVSFIADNGGLDVSTYSEHMIVRGPSIREEARNLGRLFSVWPGN